MLTLPIEEGSAKVRTRPADRRRAEDYALDVWAGVVPLALTRGEPVQDLRLTKLSRRWSSRSTARPAPASPRWLALSRASSASRTSTRGRCTAPSGSARREDDIAPPRSPQRIGIEHRRPRPDRRPRRDRRDPHARDLRAPHRRSPPTRRSATCWSPSSRRSWPTATGSPRAATSRPSSRPTPPSRSSSRPTPNERARRRVEQRGGDTQQVRRDQDERDRRDATGARTVHEPAPDAVPIDTTGLILDEVVAQIVMLAVEARELR